MIGLPLITVRNNTRIKGIHTAISLEVRKLEIEFKTTLTRNLGTFFNPFDPKQENIYTSLQLGYQFNDLGHVSVQTGFDYLSEFKDVFGAALMYRYQF